MITIAKAQNQTLGIGVVVPKGDDFTFYAKGGVDLDVARSDIYIYPGTLKKVSNLRFNNLIQLLSTM